jgi:hypothetical protein
MVKIQLEEAGTTNKEEKTILRKPEAGVLVCFMTGQEIKGCRILTSSSTSDYSLSSTEDSLDSLGKQIPLDLCEYTTSTASILLTVTRLHPIQQ